MKNPAWGLLLFLLPFSCWSQDADLLLQHDIYHYIDRVDILGRTNQIIHTDVKPFGRVETSQILSAVDTSAMNLNERGWHQRMSYMINDSLAGLRKNKGLWNLFYTNGRDAYNYSSDRFQIYINPVIHWRGGAESHTGTRFSSPIALLDNSRGIRIRANLFNKIGLFTEVYDNIRRVPTFVYQRYEDRDVLDGEEFIKTFKDQNGLDFFSTRAYLTFSPIKEIRIKFGKDRYFWGNGRQSLVLSDQAADYLLLNIRTRFWKIEYSNLFTEMIDFIPGKNDQVGTFPRKYAVFHQLSFKPNPQWSLSVFESIVYSPILANGDRGFEWQYLNPVIFYRSTEQSLGSPDNSILGISGKVNLFKSIQLYGQILIDDYNFSRRTGGSGYWGNKYGYQAGLKYIDVFNIPTLDLQLEYNRIRPYTYQHFNVSGNYTHYGQLLGHASGANLYDIFGQIQWHPLPAWQAVLNVYYLRKGMDEDGINYGGDERRSYASSRPANREFGNTVTQGSLWSIKQVYGRISYQLGKADIFADLEGIWREEPGFRSTSLMVGVRVGLPNRWIRN